MKNYDVIVVGGGPAGTAAAITAARRGARVLLLERGRYPRQKVCGEFLSAESLDLLRDLLRDEPGALAALSAAPRIGRARVCVGAKRFEAKIDPPAASLARYDLDAWLWRAAEHAGVEAIQGVEVRKVRKASDEGDSTAELPKCGTAELKEQSTLGPRDTDFVVEVAAPGDTGERPCYQAGVVVNAAGRSSRVMPQTSERAQRWIGVKAHFRAKPGDLEGAGVTELFAFDGGYCGVQPVWCGGEMYLNACALVKAGTARSLEEIFARHPELRQRSRGWEQASETVTTAAVSFRAPRTERDGMLLAGDAAGFIDPFVGDGIAIALRSGCLAGEWAQRAREVGLESAASEYGRKYHAAFDRAFRNARRLRRLLEMPTAARSAAMLLMKLPGVAEMAVTRTRAR